MYFECEAFGLKGRSSGSIFGQVSKRFARKLADGGLFIALHLRTLTYAPVFFFFQITAELSCTHSKISAIPAIAYFFLVCHSVGSTVCLC